MLKYPNCEICKKIKSETDATDKQINDYHESKGSYEIFAKSDQNIIIEIMLSL